MMNYQKRERAAYIRFIAFMLRNMSTNKLHKALEAVTEIYKSA